MKVRTLGVLLVLVTLVGTGVYLGTHWSNTKPQSEAKKPTGSMQLVAQGGCHGAGCNGRDPSGLCDNGITVASKYVTDGLLELRYSRSCEANWGRYTPWGRNARGYFLNREGIYARVTAWNPGGTSYGTCR